jgi:glycosyltransferase involved in cell wall biosynthesis
MKKIVFVSDMGILGSGYKNISVSLCKGLAEAGHEIKVLGLEYKMEEHTFPFSIIPVKTYTELYTMINNLWELWKFDILIVALDIPQQQKVLAMKKDLISQRPQVDFKYWGIFPVEAPPLSRSQAFDLMGIDRSFVISEFGTKLVRDAGIEAEYLPVGVDYESWRIPTEEERKALRQAFAISDSTFVVLTVADNQERKNISRTAQILQKFRDEVHKDILWILISRLKLSVGWNLPDLVSDLGIADVYMGVERGMPFKELWSYYAMSDAFLLTSKAEGLGLPLLEAMSVGLPIVATDCTGMKENIRKGGGFPIKTEKLSAEMIDPFGNQTRYIADVDSGVVQLNNVFSELGTVVQTKKARGYVETLQWKNSVWVLLRAMEND